MDPTTTLRVGVRGVVAVATFALCSHLILGWAKQSHLTEDPIEGARANVSREVPTLTSPPNRSTCPTVILFGSSQSSTVAAMNPGGRRIGDHFGTTIDALAEAWGNDRVCFHRIATPGLLPGEMLPLVAFEVERGTRPRIVIAPIIWESLAHDDYFRPVARDLLADPTFASAMQTKLAASGTAESVITEYAREAAAAREEALQRGRANPGERLDAAFSAAVGPHLPVLGNIDAQVTLRRETFEKLLALLTHGGVTNVHEVVPLRLERNMQKLVALADYLRSEHITLVAYRVPERTDVPPLTSRAGQEGAMATLRRELEARGAFILDLHDVVPNPLWGWAGPTPDRTHFGLRGHELVGAALVRSGRASGAFRQIEPPVSE